VRGQPRGRPARPDRFAAFWTSVIVSDLIE